MRFVIDESEFFIEGERRLGRYTVVLLQQTSSGWTPSVMQLDAIVTNYRLLLRPFRKKFTPASIPGQYITRLQQIEKDRKHVIALELLHEHAIYIMMSSGQLRDLLDDLSTMKLPVPQFTWDEDTARTNVSRLIEFFRGADVLE